MILHFTDEVGNPLDIEDIELDQATADWLVAEADRAGMTLEEIVLAKLKEAIKAYDSVA